MEFREKLYTLRKGRKMSQEDLAESLDVSRQAVQKWEAGTASPDTKNLIGISQYFEISLDVLLRDDLSLEAADDLGNPPAPAAPVYQPWHHEYKSKRTLFGLPLVHINVGHGPRKAKGIVAVGRVAVGIIAVGGVSIGLFSIGGLCLGLFAVGGVGLGGLVLGGLSVGVVAMGGASVGVVAVGGIAVGVYAMGGLAIASKIALGDLAIGPLAIGREVYGEYVATGALTPWDVKKVIMDRYPGLWEPLAWLFSVALPRKF